MIYFDNAATTFPKPESVVQGLRAGVLQYGGNPGRSGHSLSMKTAEKIFRVRSAAADLFGADVERVIFTSNCSHSLNVAIKGSIESGHVITTCLEHNSVLRPLESLQHSGKISYSVADVHNKTPDEIVEEIRGLVRMDTKLVVCTHASNVTGQILPIARIAQMCRRNGLLLIVDAAQTAGVLPIKVDDMGIDILCTAGHKGLYGPTGTGLLILGKDVNLLPLMEGGTGSKSLELTQPDFYPDRLEAGTLNSVGICGLGAGIDFVRKQGINRIYQHEIGICRMVFRSFQKFPHVELYTDRFEPGERAPVLIFNIKGKTSEEITSFLNDKGFALRGGLHCAPLVHQALGTEKNGAVRFSPSAFNTKAEAEKFIRTVGGIR